MEQQADNLKELDKQAHETSKQFFDKHDKNLEMDTEQRSNLFEDVVAEMQSAMKLVQKKFGTLEKKIR